MVNEPVRRGARRGRRSLRPGGGFGRPCSHARTGTTAAGDLLLAGHVRCPRADGDGVCCNASFVRVRPMPARGRGRLPGPTSLGAQGLGFPAPGPGGSKAEAPWNPGGAGARAGQARPGWMGRAWGWTDRWGAGPIHCQFPALGLWIFGLSRPRRPRARARYQRFAFRNRITRGFLHLPRHLLQDCMSGRDHARWLLTVFHLINEQFDFLIFFIPLQKMLRLMIRGNPCLYEKDTHFHIAQRY